MNVAFLSPQSYRNHLDTQNAVSVWSIDYTLEGAILAIMSLGLIMVGSSSISIAHKMGNPFHYFERQAIFMAIGVIAAFITMKIPTRVWHKLGIFVLTLSFVLLVMVLIPGIGKTVNGSSRWIPLGIFNLQASELTKLFMIIYLSGYLVRRGQSVRDSFRGFCVPMFTLSVAGLLLLLEPDFGSAVVLSATCLGMLFLAGAQIWQYAMLMGMSCMMMALLAIASPYRMARLTAFLNPWADQFDSGFQLTQSLIAIGSGEWFGRGLGNSVQKLFYLPEAHTDFLFAVFAEELGLIGVVILILLFAFIVMRSFKIGVTAERCGNHFGGYLAYGIGLWIGMQAFVNMGVNMGVLPTKGLTLPLMSYGGSSLIVMCITFGLLLRVDYENKLLQATQNENAATNIKAKKKTARKESVQK